jgi:hypothetical protein
VYYEEGDSTKSVVPDDFVVKDCDPGRRRTFKVWEEGKAPDVAFEVTSRGSRREDEIWKPQIYARLGILEYFLYDPTSEYLDPPLQGFRLEKSRYRRIIPNKAGLLQCRALSITLGLAEGELVFSDRLSRAVLVTTAEAAEAARDRAEAQCAAAKTRAAQLEVKRLKRQLKAKPRGS